MNPHLAPTKLLNFDDPALVSLMRKRGWAQLPEFERIGAIYEFVQNEIRFGYNIADDIPASQVLQNGLGQCNTKGTLLMALLRACGIPCRFHGFTIDKQLQKGAIAGLAYALAPRSIIHSWVEVLVNGKWVNLEGFILDRPYLESVQRRFANVNGAFCGYAIATPDLRNPPIQWQGGDTYIQKEGINHDYGVFDSPDEFYERHGANLSGVKRLLYQLLVRGWMNRNVSRIRNGAWS